MKRIVKANVIHKLDVTLKFVTLRIMVTLARM